jgi:Raf kinase inhibitor-like YbhB/YbcL family protein
MFILTSLSYKDKDPIPVRFAHHTVAGGKNVSPGFSWNDPPPGVKSFAFSLIDPHPVAKYWVHWFLVNIHREERKIVEGASRTNSLPPGAKELMNTYNEIGYGGPSPPPGSGIHPYIATLYALSIETLILPVRTNLSQFQEALKGKIIAEAATTGYYEIQ